jgi:hypothetical protein
MPEVSKLGSQAIAQILEWSADAQVARRKVAAGSAAFYTLTGTIAAYSKTLGLLIALRHRENFCARKARSDEHDGNASDNLDVISNYKGPTHYVAEKLSRLWAALS